MIKPGVIIITASETAQKKDARQKSFLLNVFHKQRFQGETSRFLTAESEQFFFKILEKES
jgi:hypothetical protein